MRLRIRKSILSVVTCLFILLFAYRTLLAGSISPDLQSVLQSSAPSEEIPVIITLSDQADLSLIKGEKDKHLRREKIVKELRRKADVTQGPLKAFLEGKGPKKMVPLWIVNGIAATLPAGTIAQIADFPGVGFVDLDYIIEAPPMTLATTAPVEWNISAIKIHDLWESGFTGKGVVVASMDTGVDVNHPDLQSKWRGGTDSWFNPYSDPANAGQCAIPSNCTPCELSSSTPCDADGHGTGTMGIMIGGSAGGTAIGVAPDAKWVAVKIFPDPIPPNNRPGAPSDIILQGFQWLMALPADRAPDVVNNSWGFQNVSVCNTLFHISISNMKAAGIELVFSAGNSGPNPSTSVSPANNPGSFAVGATDNTNTIASFSSRGPSACDGSIFPHVVAPGVNIKVADLQLIPSPPADPAYQYLSGTSFSAPHVAGAAALLLGTMPALTPAQIEEAFQNTALPLGDPVPNNTYGYGLLNAEAAYRYAFIHFSGKGDAPQIAGPSSVFFINVTTTDTATFLIVNQGTADLTINSTSIAGMNPGDFAITSDTCSGQTIPSLSSCSVTVTFTPGAEGRRSALLSVSSNDAATPILDIPLTGNDPIALVHDSEIVATYSDIQTASNDSSNWDVIRMRAVTLTESPVFNLPLGITISLQGGYDAAFGSQTSYTTVQGIMTITKGTVIVGNVVVQ